MPETGAKIGAVLDPETVHDRVRISNLYRRRRSESDGLTYQTLWPALVPGRRRRSLTDLEVQSFTTQEADSRQHLIFVRVDDSAIEVLQNDPHPGQIVTLADGIAANFGRFRTAEANNITTARMSHSQNPQYVEEARFPDGAHVGLHFDRGSGLVVSERDTDKRRLVVNLGPSDRFSLAAVPWSLPETLSKMHMDATDYDPSSYIPIADDVMPYVARHAAGMQVLWTRLKTNEGYVLPAHTALHDGSSYGKGESKTAVLYELNNPDQWWQGKDLVANSVFQ